MIKNLVLTLASLTALAALVTFANHQLVREEANECDHWARQPGFVPGEYCTGAWEARAELDRQ